MLEIATVLEKGVMNFAECIRKLEKCIVMILLAIYLVVAPAGPSKFWFFTV